MRAAHADRLRTRRWKAKDICAEVEPKLSALADNSSQATACHFLEPLIQTIATIAQPTPKESLHIEPE